MPDDTHRHYDMRRRQHQGQDPVHLRKDADELLWLTFNGYTFHEKDIVTLYDRVAMLERLVARLMEEVAG